MKSLLTAGVTPASGIGFHGSNIDAVMVAAETGILPAGLQDNSIYFFPRPSIIKIQNPRCELEDSDQAAFDGSWRYANQLGGDVILLRILGIPWERSTQCHDMCYALLDDSTAISYDIKRFKTVMPPELIDFVDKLGLDELEKTVTRINRSVGGILLAISPRVFDDFTVEEAVQGDDGLRIICPEGLPLSYIVGMIGCGEYEERILNSVTGS